MAITVTSKFIRKYSSFPPGYNYIALRNLHYFIGHGTLQHCNIGSTYCYLQEFLAQYDNRVTAIFCGTDSNRNFVVKTQVG